MNKILVSDQLANEGMEILKAVKEFQVDYKIDLKPEQLKAIIKDYDALIVRSSTKVTEDIIQAASRLRFIGRAGVGLDNVDLKAATQKGIVAINTPAGNTTSTAEHTMSMILALSRNIPQACASVKAGKWERSKFSGVELHGKTIGIIGFGRIGSTVARYAKAFGMSAMVYDPYISLEVGATLGVQMVDLKVLIKESDYITIHIPKSAETKNLIGDAEFQLMKKTARLINCARGGIVDEAALAKTLETKRIAGCALDVFDEEPVPAGSPLLKLDNCIMTPHLGASTSEAQVNVAIEIAETIRNALLGKGIMNAANFPAVDAEAYKTLEPYINLAYRMGKFAGQLIAGRISAIKITYNGVVSKYKVAPVTLSLVNGLLTPILGETVNFVNALEIAKGRAINVQEVVSTKEEEFVNAIRVEVKTDKEPFVILGTLSANHKPRIVKINNVYMEAIPDGHILFIQNNDKPGLVGAIGTLLAEAKINIAGITLGREAPGGLAISAVNVDSDVPEKTMERLRNAQDVLYVKLLKI